MEDYLDEKTKEHRAAERVMARMLGLPAPVYLDWYDRPLLTHKQIVAFLEAIGESSGPIEIRVRKEVNE